MLNKELDFGSGEVTWKGQKVASVRALTPQDIAVILVKAGENIAGLFLAADDLDMGSLDLKNTELLADQLTARAPKVMLKIAQSAPDLIAQIIAQAADATEDPEAVDSIMAWPFPLQSRYLTQLAVHSFGDSEGFRMFLGEVSALVGAWSSLTSAKFSKTYNGQGANDSSAGSETSSRPSLS